MGHLRSAIAVAAIACLLVGFGLLQAHAHDAPSGWSYPLDCCSGHDCRPIDPAEVQELGGGKVLDRVTGETLSGKQVRFGGDGQWHICNVGGDREAKPICVFKPQSMF